ncbi:MAG: DUF6198 family protein [Treponema sp.]|jgi:uncharacterized membrane protein YczE|nr:DUF6198 family protein [Treponema sp.]
MTANTSGGSSRLLRRLLLYLLGNFVLALGVAVAVKSDLGITPVNSIAYAASKIFSVDHGLMTALVYCGYVLIQLAILRKEFRFYGFLQIGVAMLFGLFVSLCNRILSFHVPEAYWTRLLLMLVSVVIIALGILLYLRADLLPQPAEGLMLAIQKKTGWKLHNIKIIFDFTVVAAAAALSLFTVHRITGIREGTLIAMLGVGKVMGLLSGPLGKKIDALFRLNNEG